MCLEVHAARLEVAQVGLGEGEPDQPARNPVDRGFAHHGARKLRLVGEDGLGQQQGDQAVRADPPGRCTQAQTVLGFPVRPQRERLASFWLQQRVRCSNHLSGVDRFIVPGRIDQGIGLGRKWRLRNQGVVQCGRLEGCGGGGPQQQGLHRTHLESGLVGSGAAELGVAILSRRNGDGSQLTIADTRRLTPEQGYAQLPVDGLRRPAAFEAGTADSLGLVMITRHLRTDDGIERSGWQLRHRPANEGRQQVLSAFGLADKVSPDRSQHLVARRATAGKRVQRRRDIGRCERGRARGRVDTLVQAALLALVLRARHRRLQIPARRKFALDATKDAGVAGRTRRTGASVLQPERRGHSDRHAERVVRVARRHDNTVQLHPRKV